jgi:WD40 repeat protein
LALSISRCWLLLALAHQEKALALLGQAGASGDSRDLQQALLHTLAAQRLPAHGGMVRALAFSPNGRRIASGGQDGLLKLWDPASGTEAAELAPGGGWIESLAFSPDGRLLVAGAIQGGVHVWTLDGDAAPAPRAVLDNGRDKLDQLLDWLAAQGR